LSAFENNQGGKGSGVRSLPSSPLLRPTSGTATPKYLPIGGSPRIAPLSSPRLPPSSPQTSMTSLRVRLIHILALGPTSEQSLQEKTRALRTELSTCLQEVARKIATGSSSWELKDECYRELKPKEWKNYTTKERETVDKKRTGVLARLPPVQAASEDVLRPTEIPMKQSASKVAEDYKPLATTPVHVGSPALKPSSSIPAKRRAEDEMVNPISKAGRAGTAAKIGSTRATIQSDSNTKAATERKPMSKTAQLKTSPPRKTKESRKVKSEEKIMDSNSDSDSDIPLEKHVRSSTTRKSQAKTEQNSVELKGLGITTAVSESKRPPHVVSPSGFNENCSHTSSASSTTSYSPPKKRSPLATNEPLTAQRPKPHKPSSPPQNGKKRPREADNSKTEKRPKVYPIADKGNSNMAAVTEKHVLDDTANGVSLSGKRNSGQKPEVKHKRIEQQHHDIAEQFRKLYPEYQELHRRLQSLDADRLALEKGDVARLFQMQEQLEEWKATLWKAAGETRRVVTTTKMARGIVGVRV
jgi:hypothetical protein